MALRFIDGFDHYTWAQATRKWTSTNGSASIATTSGRRGGGAFYAAASTRSMSKTIDAQATWIIGVAVYLTGYGTGTDAFLQVIDGSTIHLSLQVNGSGNVIVTRANTTTLATSSSAISLNTWVYLELKCTINDTTGSFDLRFNGSSVASGTNVDTRNGGNATANVIRIGSISTNSPLGYFDDLYVCDGTGSANNDFLGDVRVDAYLPNGNGNSSQLVGSDSNSTDNYLLVDESTPDDDTTYVESSTAGNKDTYAFANMAHTPASIFGVQVNACAKKDDSGTRSIATVVRSGGSDTDGATQALSTSYSYAMQIHETDPNTSAAWTKSGYDGAEFGVKVAV